MSRRPHKELRACLLCSILLSLSQFSESGCPNCQDLLSSAHDGTTSNWEGVIAVVDPKDSWVSKWQGLSSFVPGIYAVRYKNTKSLEMLTALG
jgi:transcription elongation factor SPT4